MLKLLLKLRNYNQIAPEKHSISGLILLLVKTPLYILKLPPLVKHICIKGTLGAFLKLIK